MREETGKTERLVYENAVNVRPNLRRSDAAHMNVVANKMLDRDGTAHENDHSI